MDHFIMRKIYFKNYLLSSAIYHPQELNHCILTITLQPTHLWVQVVMLAYSIENLAKYRMSHPSWVWHNLRKSIFGNHMLVSVVLFEHLTACWQWEDIDLKFCVLVYIYVMGWYRKLVHLFITCKAKLWTVYFVLFLKEWKVLKVIYFQVISYCIATLLWCSIQWGMRKTPQCMFFFSGIHRQWKKYHFFRKIIFFFF
jgi:hypothetical protein